MVVLVGRAEQANIELHDVTLVIGSKFKNTYDTLIKDWFWSSRAFILIAIKKTIFRGLKINLKNVEKNKIVKK